MRFRPHLNAALLAGLHGFAAARRAENANRFDPASRDEADSSDNGLPIAGLGSKVLGVIDAQGRIAASGTGAFDSAAAVERLLKEK